VAMNIGQRRSASLGNAMVWLMGGYAISLVGYLAVNIMSARLLGAGVYGSFLVVTTVAFVVGQLALFGAHRAGLREVARLDRADRAGLAAIGREGAAIVCLAVPAVAAASALLYIAVSGAGLDGNRVLLGIELGLLICVNALQKLGANYLRGLGRLAAASFVDGSSGGALTLSVQSLLLGVLLLTGSTPALPAVLAVVAAGYLPSMLVIVGLLRGLWRAVRLPEMLASLRRSVQRYRVFAVIQVVGYAGASLEIWLAALTLSAHHASYFGAAQRLALMSAVPLTALQSVASPAISRTVLTRTRGLLEGALRTSATLALLSACAFAIPVVIWPDLVLGIFFEGEPTGFAGVLIILLIGQLINVATGMCGPVLTMTRFEGTVAKATTLGLVLRVAIGIPAAVMGGAMGLAVTATAVSAFMWVYLVVQARTKCSLNTLPTLRPTLGSLQVVKG
jgi:O-antigen/teichoic acid export membrane protein